jgi:redox-regulated HSP33 family molecular chaperone
MPPGDLADLVDDGAIVVTCQFCNRTQSFTLADVETAEPLESRAARGSS